MICLMCTITIPDQAKANDSRFTVTFAGATVIGGIYILISWSVSDSFDQHLYPFAHSALFNHDSNGWLVGVPEIKFTEHNKSYLTPYVDLFKIRF